jgi:hypothetical protein
MNCKILRKKAEHRKNLPRAEHQIKSHTIEKLVRIREENAKLKQQIANMEYEHKNLTKKPTVHQNQTFTTNFID